MTALPFKPLIKTLRAHQWAKNLLIFVPVVLAHQYRDTAAWTVLFRVFAAFCCVASAGYVVNDIVDAPVDRAHPGKRLRPFASGTLSPRVGWAWAGFLMILGLSLAASASFPLLAVVSGYFATSLFYSFSLKSQPLLDVFCLTCLYAVRLFSGGLAVSVEISPWLVSFAVFFFLNLAFLKRYTELGLFRAEGGAKKVRGYLTGDGKFVMAFGSTCGIVSALILALYMNSDRVFTLYRHPEFLWAICFFLLYWVARAWLIAHRGEMHEDPVMFVMHDRASYVVLLLCVIVLALAI